MQMLQKAQAGDYEAAEALRAIYEPLEDLRNAHGPIPVLHHAVTLSGIADMGPFLPLLAPLAEELQSRIGTVAKALLERNSEASLV